MRFISRLVIRFSAIKPVLKYRRVLVINTRILIDKTINTLSVIIPGINVLLMPSYIDILP